MSDAGLKDLADCPVQGSDFRSTKRCRTPRGPDPCSEERLICVDVPDAGDFCLSQEEGLNLRGGSAQSLEDVGRECRSQRLDADMQRFFHAVCREDEHLAELSDVSVVEDPTRVEDEFGVRVLVRPEAIAAFGPEELSRHSQSHDQTVTPKIEHEELPAPAEGLHLPSSQCRLHLTGGSSTARQARLGDFGAPDPAPLDPPYQVSADHFDFGKLRHRRTQTFHRQGAKATRDES